MVKPINPLSVSQRILLLGHPEATTEWSPLALPNLLLWLDATAILNRTNGDPLAVWSDKSPQHNDATQPTFAQRPAFRLVGGKPVVRFDGADDGLVLATRIDPAPLYAALVVRTNSATTESILLSTYEGADGGFALGVRSATTLKCFTAGSDPAYPGAFATNTFTLVEASHDGANKTLFLDGVALQTNACPLLYGSNPAYRSSIGFFDYLGGGYQRFGGDIAEMVVCGAIPGGSALSSLRSSLAAKWGIGLASGGSAVGLGGGN